MISFSRAQMNNRGQIRVASPEFFGSVAVLQRENNLLPRRVRNAVLAADRHRCVYCGGTKPLCVDHVVPKDQGRDDRWQNLCTLCQVCNRTKSNYFVGPDGKVVYRTYGTFGVTANRQKAAAILAAERRALHNPFRWLRLAVAVRASS